MLAHADSTLNHTVIITHTATSDLSRARCGFQYKDDIIPETCKIYSCPSRDNK
jgi:hypothetical protein